MPYPRPFETPTSRRDFLKLAGTAAALSAASPLTAWSAAAEADPYGGFKMCIQSYSLRAFDVQSALSHSQRLGLRFWESFPGHIPLSTVPSHVRQHQAMLKDADITLLAYGVVSLNDDENKAREIFDFARAMGLVSISANPKKDAAVFDLLDKLVEEYGIPIAIHNHGPGATYDKIDDVVEWTKDRHPLIGACVDTGHYLRSNENPVEALERLGRRVFGVHLKDAKTIRDPQELARLAKELPQGAADRLRQEGKMMTILGEGELDVVGCLKVLRQNEFDRSLSLEYEENPDNPLSDIEVCLNTVREAVQQL